MANLFFLKDTRPYLEAYCGEQGGRLGEFDVLHVMVQVAAT